jgi:hypothetical protein
LSSVHLSVRFVLSLYDDEREATSRKFSDFVYWLKKPNKKKENIGPLYFLSNIFYK